MLAFLKSSADFSRGCAHLAMQPPIPTTHPTPQYRDRSLAFWAPVQRGSRSRLPWTALHLRVDVDDHPRGAQASLASYLRTTLNIEHAPLQASHAGALLVGTRFCSHHDHAINSSTSWS